MNKVAKRFPMCCYCGACAAFIPYFDQFKKDEAMTKKGCIELSPQGSCFDVCPKSYAICSEDRGGCIRNDYNNCNLNLGNNLNGHEGIGYYESIVSARATNKDHAKKGQDGGVVSTLLDLALKEGIIDSAVVAGKSESEPWRPEPIIATDTEDILSSSGSKYTACPSILGVLNAIDEGYEKIALVGTPCNIEAMRKIQSQHDNNLHADRVKLLIGLFCTEMFWYYDLIQYLKEVGVDIDDVSKFDISKGKFVVYTTDGKKELSLKELEPFVRSSCEVCNDFSSEFADISAGSIGSDEGWTTLIVRTKKGEDLINLAVDRNVIETEPISSEAFSKIKKASINKKIKNWDNLLQQMEYCAACLSSPSPEILMA
ncbi:MAG: Coenzyme F420 hydrogenase/dehydrogenase, beta subunit C-terminal domain [Halobacteriota archaeon]|nr:Coenzyme F420 hydrogenase/dehydrogenase, beta subunit C-terminal domain [Halobacteriota archaeon]